jgi:hypothetical protein
MIDPKDIVFCGTRVGDMEKPQLVHFIGQLDMQIAAMVKIVNTPETIDFMKGVPLEAAHQRERWGTDQDAGKGALDWFWLIGYLAQKAATAQLAGDLEKAKHHTISTAATLANWHLRLTGAPIPTLPAIEQLITNDRPEGK